MTWKTKWRQPDIRKGTTRGLTLAVEHVLNKANQTVPIEEGTLQNSGQASVDGRTATVSYDTPYAVRVHEDMNARHDPGRTAKWLENTFTSQRKQVAEIIAAEIRGLL